MNSLFGKENIKGSKDSDNNARHIVYQPPAIIYEGEISTRAGSPLSDSSGHDALDPADLFGE